MQQRKAQTTPHMTLASGQLLVVECLLEHRADIEASNANDRTAIQYAVASSQKRRTGQIWCKVPIIRTLHYIRAFQLHRTLYQHASFFPPLPICLVRFLAN